MDRPVIHFDDGEAYERGMGVWSHLAGRVFLDWLEPLSGLRWVDVGCGNGAFTELLIRRCAPSEAQGIDPSEAQLAFARARPAARDATFLQGDAMALPFESGRFDAAVMALVIFFVPDPAKGVTEMVRVVRPGGLVSAYVWDVAGGGTPIEPIWDEMRAMGVTPPLPPSVDASRMTALRELWTAAGLDAVETREIAVQRVFADFDDFWNTGMMIGGLRAVTDAMPESHAADLKERVRARLPADHSGRIISDASANAVQGRVPG